MYPRYFYCTVSILHEETYISLKGNLKLILTDAVAYSANRLYIIAFGIRLLELLSDPAHVNIKSILVSRIAHVPDSIEDAALSHYLASVLR